MGQTENRQVAEDTNTAVLTPRQSPLIISVYVSMVLVVKIEHTFEVGTVVGCGLGTGVGFWDGCGLGTPHAVPTLVPNE